MFWLQPNLSFMFWLQPNLSFMYWETAIDLAMAALMV